MGSQFLSTIFTNWQVFYFNSTLIPWKELFLIYIKCQDDDNSPISNFLWLGGLQHSGWNLLPVSLVALWAQVKRSKRLISTIIKEVQWTPSEMFLLLRKENIWHGGNLKLILPLCTWVSGPFARWLSLAFKILTVNLATRETKIMAWMDCI